MKVNLDVLWVYLEMLCSGSVVLTYVGVSLWCFYTEAI